MKLILEAASYSSKYSVSPQHNEYAEKESFSQDLDEEISFPGPFLYFCLF